ncbi:MAG TPA: thioredoxin, partial [Gammaproteobacteria bacterium]|nr:thioredoxin [Gammaproteobacteria bacterium]
EAPKFPHESMLLLLIDEQKRNPNDEQLNAITTTLDIMASGGLYDTVGGGFHRYSTDNTWLIPHFEKMLYNQAQLSLVYTRAYQLTHKPLYRRIAQQTLDYVLKEMQDKNGGFFSATDADSEGEEGTYFVWSIDEIKTVLNKDEFKHFNQWFDLSSHTDFEGNHVIRFKDINDVNVDDYKQIDGLLAKLYNVRIKREPPLTDNKVLLSWNALMVPSLIEAGKVFNEEKYTTAGLALASRLESFNKNNQLYRVSINNKLETNALFEDYAYLANAYLSVFDQTNEKKWLNRAVQLVNTMNEKFWDKERFGYNMTNDNKYLNTRYKESYDG